MVVLNLPVNSTPLSLCLPLTPLGEVGGMH